MANESDKFLLDLFVCFLIISLFLVSWSILSGESVADRLMVMMMMMMRNVAK